MESLSIEILNEDHNLMSSIREKMGSISSSYCVCKVPQELTRGCEEHYFPRSVSIGPYHHGQENLKTMEDRKWRFLSTLLNRKPNAEEVLNDCIASLRQDEQKARNFYCEQPTDQKMGSDQFVEMLLLDGCFLIELFLEYTYKTLRRRDDPCFGTVNAIQQLRKDLVLLENQIPFFVLEKLFHLVHLPKHCNLSIVELALSFFRRLIPGDVSQFSSMESSFAPETHHLLDLIRQHYLPATSPELSLRSPNGHNQQARVPHASRLRELGVRIERDVSREKSPLNVKFVNGVLRIPTLKIHGYTETLFRNLIAMELCHPKCSKRVASYAVLMEGLVRSERDVVLLRGKEIIVVDGGGEGGDDVALLFKKLRVDVRAEEFNYGGLCEKVNGYRRGNRRAAVLESVRHVYRRTRLGVAGFVLAVLLLVFVFAGALFAAIYVLMHHFL